MTGYADNYPKQLEEEIAMLECLVRVRHVRVNGACELKDVGDDNEGCSPLFRFHAPLVMASILSSTHRRHCRGIVGPRRWQI